jgi:hypothetical protein
MWQKLTDADALTRRVSARCAHMGPPRPSFPSRFQDCANPQTTGKKDCTALASVRTGKWTYLFPHFGEDKVIGASSTRLRTGGLGMWERDFPENHGAYFFFAAAFGAGLVGALAFAFFLSLPWELFPLAMVNSSLERCCASITACCIYHNRNPAHPSPLWPFCARNLVPSFSGPYNNPLESIFFTRRYHDGRQAE